jgi:hypothetical protein
MQKQDIDRHGEEPQNEATWGIAVKNRYRTGRPHPLAGVRHDGFPRIAFSFNPELGFNLHPRHRFQLEFARIDLSQKFPCHKHNELFAAHNN